MAVSVAMVGRSGDTAPFPLDTMEGTRIAKEVEIISYSSQWDGGDCAMVTIAQDGVTLGERLSGEGDRAWSVTHNGTYVLTHTTYTNGVSGKVETAMFVVIGRDVPPAEIRSVTARPRYPWNGKVDVSFELDCEKNIEGLAAEATDYLYSVSLIAKDLVGGTNLPMRTVYKVDGTAVNPAGESLVSGTYRWVWDAAADLPDGWESDHVAVTAGVNGYEAHGKIQLWEGGPYWATTNIGAEEPWEPGYYFWWGDTVGYKRENDAWVASDGSSYDFSFSVSNTPTDSKTPDTLQSEGWLVSQDGTYMLAPEHDAAHVQWGGTWRMPTYQELRYLNSKCDWTWAAKNGVNGYVVRGRGDYAANSIFLPFTGDGYETSLRQADSAGNYWSSSPWSDTAPNGSWYLYRNYGLSAPRIEYGSRHCGLPVRPVQGFNE